MKGNRIYLILLGIMLVVSIHFYLRHGSGSQGSYDEDFAVADTGSVELIVLSRAGEQVELSRTGGSWRVNGFPARKESILGMQVLISRIEVEAPVPRSDEERISAMLESEGIGVQIGFRDGGVKAYHVCFDSASVSTFLMIDGSDAAYRVRVRGYRNRNLTEFFIMDERYWRNNVFFQYQPGEISKVFLQNNRFPSKSFHLQRNDTGGFSVAPGIIPGPWSDAGKERVEQYLGYFYDVRFDTFMDARKDTLQHDENPDYILNVELLNGSRSSVEFFPVFHLSAGGMVKPDYNILYAKIDMDEDWVVVKYIEIDPLLKEYEYFTGIKK